MNIEFPELLLASTQTWTMMRLHSEIEISASYGRGSETRGFRAVTVGSGYFTESRKL